MTTTLRPQQATVRNDTTLIVVDEMVDLLKDLTRAGQRYMMEKIVAVLCVHPSALAGGPFVARRLEDLRREGGKVDPDGDAFGHTARALLATISADRATR